MVALINELPLHPICCIEDCIKECLKPYTKLFYTLVCDLDGCWCVPEQINENVCGVNIYIEEEESLDIDTISANGCGPTVDSMRAELVVEIYALHCDGARRRAKRCLSLIQQLLCECQSQTPVEQIKYRGMSVTTHSDQMEQQFAVIRTRYTLDYTFRHCNSKILRPACLGT